MQKCLKLKKLQREIIKKVSKVELSILCTVRLFMWVYIPTIPTISDAYNRQERNSILCHLTSLKHAHDIINW